MDVLVGIWKTEMDLEVQSHQLCNGNKYRLLKYLFYFS